MATKDRLQNLLTHSPAPQSLRRGEGLTLSTEQAGQEEALSKPTRVPPKRINRGFRIREDITHLLRLLAVEEHKMLYEVMEEACIAHLRRKHKWDRQQD